LYSPEQVKEYGSVKGKVYVAKDISSGDTVKKVFLEQLYQGTVKLYYYIDSLHVKKYFLEKDSMKPFEISRQNEEGIDFRKQLLEITSDCQNVSNAAKVSTYKKIYMTKLVARYDHCELKPFPHIRYGICMGYSLLKLIPASKYEYLHDFNFGYDGATTFGLQIDKPIMASDFYLHSEINFAKHGFYYNELVDNEDIEFTANLSSLTLPVLLRYSLPFSKIRPFLNLGFNLAFRLQDDCMFYKTRITGNTVETIQAYKIRVSDRCNYGFSAGGGLEYDLSYRNSLFVDFRYNKSYSSSYPVDISEYVMAAGIYFSL
jgi:hypothetical protein